MHNSLPLEIAKELKQEADYILFTLKINNILQKLGKVIIGGSYALNLLAWRDLDIYLVPHNKQDFDLQLLELGKAFLKYDETILIKLERHLHKRIIHCPAGHYLQVKFLLNNLLSWKIDIWIIDDETLTKNIEHLHAVTAKLTAETRKLILETKQAIMTPAGRTPSFSGYFIYQAILFEGIREQSEILDFLEKSGVKTN